MSRRHVPPAHHAPLTRRSLARAAFAALLATGPSSRTLAADRPSTARPGVHVLPPLAMPALHRSRTLRVYLPPSYDRAPQRRYPVIYMHDGQNLFDDATSYAGEWGVDEAMDELARTRGLEAIVVGIDHGGERRLAELVPWPNPRLPPPEGDAYTAWIAGTLKPWIDAHYRTRPDRASTAMIGSSLGGLITHHALLRYPQVFGKAGILSPSYFVSARVYDETKAHPWPVGTRVYLYIGGQEHLDDEPGFTENVPDVERMMALLRTQGHGDADTRMQVEPQAHHGEAAWRAVFPRVVAWLFEPGPA